MSTACFAAGRLRVNAARVSEELLGAIAPKGNVPLPKSRLIPWHPGTGCFVPFMAGPQATIAIVEDDVGMREALGRMLKTAGYDARTYGSAEAFLESAPGNLGCLIADIHLPGASGIDLQRRLREDGQAGPVIFITAHDSALFRREADELGAIAFLAKPFEGRLLVRAVGEALERGGREPEP